VSSEPLVIAAVLVAAVLHATWNAIAKGTEDRLGLFARSCAVAVAVAAALLWWLPPPARAAWPWLVGSAIVHIGYNMGLLAAYRVGDFNQTYPLARGVGPLIVTVVAVVVIGEPLPVVPAAGVVLIAVAICLLGLTPWHRVRTHRSAVVAAVLTGVAIATYTILDGIGVRRSASPVGYTLWLLGLHGLGTMAVTARLRRRNPVPVPARWSMAAATGVMSLLAYGLVLWAQTRGALAAVAALRESSVVVAAAIGAALFREPLGRVRIAASVAVATGVVLLAVS
jgi:drug/metabolite transporter (DMT)-like permease